MTKRTDILFEVKGCAGIIILNKPETLNAVTDDMLTALSLHLDKWEADDAITRVIIKAVEGRAFSAGGDIRHLYDCGIKKEYDFDFFAREYSLNACIAKFPKPYIALVDGLVMGGGVGVSFHGSHRVAGEGIGFAMPEVGIGFFPDVGASYFLSRLSDNLGLYLGLTGIRVRQADALWSGLATHACRSEDLPALEMALCQQQDVDETLAQYSSSPEMGVHEKQQTKIKELFDGRSLAQVLKNLERSAKQDEWAAVTLKTIKRNSPTGLEVAFRQIKQGQSLDIDECMKMEYRILRRILVGTDFYEGIRAAIIDKDGMPKWTPASLVGIDPADIDAHFADLGENELQLS
ncbi:MAG: enoyl-CoA hydratase/isomerase family protein [Rhizobiaceae bacterium]